MEKDEILLLRKYVSGSVYDLENIAKRQICCVAPRMFNDPVDTYFYFSNADCFKESKKILTPDIMDRIRICCFINHKEVLLKRKGNKITANELLMWTHYADSHKGICLEYQVPRRDFEFINRDKFDSTKRILQKISYMPGLATEFESFFSVSEDETYSADKFEDLLKTCFFTKDKSFEYESEMRLLEYADSKNRNTHIPVSFDYMTRIIFGERCSADMKHLVKCINKQVYKNKINLKQINNHFQEEDCDYE